MIHALTYTGDGTTKTIAALLIAGGYPAAQANAFRPLWLQAVGEGAGTARIGDVNTAAAYGIPLPTSAGQLLPPEHQPMQTYSFTSTYIYTPNGTVVSLLFDA